MTIGMDPSGPLHVSDPLYGALATHTSLFDDSERERLRRTILEAVAQDPVVEDPASIGVAFAADGHHEIHLIGRVAPGAAHDRVVEIAIENTRDDVRIVDELRVTEHTSP